MERERWEVAEFWIEGDCFEMEIPPRETAIEIKGNTFIFDGLRTDDGKRIFEEKEGHDRG